ncbi:MAG TPA: hypothetical protein VM364_00615 [Vicinamibacterales bacterium]|nr:hypothetical protein [Vicinamibacterales bacterium]
MTLRHEPIAVPQGFAGEGLREYLPIATSPRPPRRWPWLLALVTLTFIVGLWCGTQVHAASCLTLKVRPQAMLRRGDVSVEARIPRHADHRLLAVSWLSENGKDGGYQVPLEGDQAPAVRTDWLRDMPPAHYVFTAAVIDSRGKVVGRDRAEILTIEGDPR